MSDHYILDGHTAIQADLMRWAQWHETADRKVKRETIGDTDVSTVFLSVDHAYGGGPPMLFETMVFGGPLDQEQERCSTWEQAEAMHDAMCERVRNAK